MTYVDWLNEWRRKETLNANDRELQREARQTKLERDKAQKGKVKMKRNCKK